MLQIVNARISIVACTWDKHRWFLGTDANSSHGTGDGKALLSLCSCRKGKPRRHRRIVRSRHALPSYNGLTFRVRDATRHQISARDLSLLNKRLSSWQRAEMSKKLLVQPPRCIKRRSQWWRTLISPGHKDLRCFRGFPIERTSGSKETSRQRFSPSLSSRSMSPRCTAWEA